MFPAGLSDVDRLMQRIRGVCKSSGNYHKPGSKEQENVRKRKAL